MFSVTRNQTRKWIAPVAPSSPQSKRGRKIVRRRLTNRERQQLLVFAYSNNTGTTHCYKYIAYQFRVQSHTIAPVAAITLRIGHRWIHDHHDVAFFSRNFSACWVAYLVLRLLWLGRLFIFVRGVALVPDFTQMWLIHSMSRFRFSARRKSSATIRQIPNEPELDFVCRLIPCDRCPQSRWLWFFCLFASTYVYLYKRSRFCTTTGEWVVALGQLL